MKTWLRTIVITVSVLITIVVVYPHANTTFDVTAEAESVTFIPLARIGQEWKLDRVRLRRAFVDTGSVLDGTLALSDSVRVLIERKSLGPLRLELEPLDPTADNALLGTFTPPNALPVTLRGYASVEIPDLEARARQGRPLVLFAEGNLQVGRAPNRTPEPSQPLLRRGTVTMIGSSWFRSTSFPAGTAELRVGDHLQIERPLAAGVGFISADERPALTIGFRTIARSATVIRPGGGTPKIATSRYSTVLGDPLLKAALATVTFLVPILMNFSLVVRQVRARIWRRSRRRAPVSVALFFIMALVSSSAYAQSVALRGENVGQGITRPRGAADCFIITPLHVLGKSAHLLATSEGGITTEADPSERYESADLAVLEFASNPAFPCPEWNVPKNLDDVLAAGATSAVLRERARDGSIAFTPVWITNITRETIRVSPRDATGEIKSGMSGSQLLVNGMFAGILQRITDNGRTGFVMRSDNAVRVLGSFFTGRMSPEASDAVNLTLTRGKSIVLGDQHTVFGYYAGHGPLGIYVRMNGVSHEMGPGTRLTFPDSRRNCVIILMEFEEVQGIARGNERADFRVACTPK
jgi:hypothetical protein